MGGDSGDAADSRGLPSGGLYKRLSGDLTLRRRRGGSGAVQAREDGAADVAGQVPAGVGDVLRGGKEVRAVSTVICQLTRSGSVPGANWTASVTAVRSAWGQQHPVSCSMPAGSPERRTRPWSRVWRGAK